MNDLTFYMHPLQLHHLRDRVFCLLLKFVISAHNFTREMCVQWKLCVHLLRVLFSLLKYVHLLYMYIVKLKCSKDGLLIQCTCIHVAVYLLGCACTPSFAREIYIFVVTETFKSVLGNGLGPEVKIGYS